MRKFLDLESRMRNAACSNLKTMETAGNIEIIDYNRIEKAIRFI